MLRSVTYILRILFVVLLLGTLFSYAMFQGGFVSWFLFYGFLPILIYSFSMFFFPIKALKINRALSSTYASAGSNVQVTIEIKRRLPYPLFYLIIEDELPETMDWSDTRHHKYNFLKQPHMLKNRDLNKAVIFPWFKRRITYTYEVPAVPRGKHYFRQTYLSTGDAFGLVKKKRVYQVPTEIFVEPGEVKMQINQERSTFEDGQQSAYSVKANHTTVVSGIRDYAPGDQVSWVDWKTTARKQKLVTKEFEEEKHKDLTIIFNGIKQSQKDWLAFEATVELTHALLETSIRTHGNVNFVILGAGREAIELGRNPQVKERVVSLLASIQMVEGSSFYQQLQREAFHLSKDQNLIVVSHFLTKEMHDSLLLINQSNIEVEVYLVSSKELLSTEQKEWMDRLKRSGVKLIWLNEDNLTKKYIEVNA
ncbi:DUF58 domain-containing protein [Halalkalibacillus halophilus]|uniref:DUF58 domain-containing protein n=1 Tax=Halalkalibacillus halophilus TaxID=392827 RepID=UPI000685E915|nr:DUF58 domain-containing protein [Halalkalibacillus halophilus]